MKLKDGISKHLFLERPPTIEGDSAAATLSEESVAPVPTEV
jgi:hypothetical protein